RSLEAVAHYGDHQNPRAGRRDPLHEPGEQQRAEAGDEPRYDGEETEEQEAHHEDRLASHPVRNGAVEDLRGAEADQIGGDHELAAVLFSHAQGFADRRQGRQHHVNGQGVHRHDRRYDSDEFTHSRAVPFLYGRGFRDKTHTLLSLARARSGGLVSPQIVFVGVVDLDLDHVAGPERLAIGDIDIAVDLRRVALGTADGAVLVHRVDDHV